MEVDNESIRSSDSFASMASNVTRCTNPTFSRVVNKLWSDPVMQKDVMSVLAAVTRIIQEKGGKESAVEYYAVLMNLFNSETKTKQAEAYLLRLLMTKALTTPIMRNTCAEASKTILNVMHYAMSAEEPNVGLVKSLLYCLGSLLRAQSLDSWSTESIRHSFRILLKFVCHEKPAWRKACHESLVMIVNSVLESDIVTTHPASHQTVEFVLTLIDQEKTSLCALVKIRDADCTRLMQAINLVGLLAFALNAADLKRVIELLLDLTKFPNRVVAEKSYESVCKVFEMHPPVDRLPMELCCRLITALYAIKPLEPTVIDLGNLNVIQAWFSTVYTVLCHLSFLVKAQQVKSTDLKLVNDHLDRFICILFDSVVNSSLAGMRKFAGQLFDKTLTDLVYVHMVECQLNEQLPQLLPNLTHQVQQSLVLRYRDSWLLTLPILARLIRIWASVLTTPTSLPAPLKDNLVNLGQLRDSLADGSCPLLDSHTSEEDKNALVDEIDRVIVAGLISWGPELVLTEAIPLEPLLNELEAGKTLHLLRSWLLPLLMDCKPQQSCSLDFFCDHILGLADRAVQVARKSAQVPTTSLSTGPSRSAKINSAITLANQLWCTLPAFLYQEPTSWLPLSEKLAKRLADEFISTPLLRTPILCSIQAMCQLVNQSVNSDSGLKAMRNEARLLIPRMLTVYEDSDVEADQELRQRIRNCLSGYFALLTPKVVATPCQVALQKFEKTQNGTLLELISFMVPFMATDALVKLMQTVGPLLDSPDAVMRKRAYRILEEICATRTETTREYTEKNYREMIRLLSSQESLVAKLAGLSVGPGGVKKTGKLPWKARLRILRSLLRELIIDMQSHFADEEQARNNIDIVAFVDAFFQETLNAFHESGKAIHQEACGLLNDFVHALAGLVSPKFQQTVQQDEETRMDEDEYDDEQQIEEDCASSVSSVAQLVGDCAGKAKLGQQTAVCQGLLDFVPRLLQRLPPVLPLETSEETAQKSEDQKFKSACSALCGLFQQAPIKQALETILSQPEDSSTGLRPSLVELFTAMLKVAESLTHSRRRPVAAIGLQIVRALVCYAGRWIYVSDLIQPVLHCNPKVKPALKVTIRNLVRKLVKKVGATSLRSLMPLEYNKMLNNLQKEEVKAEKRKKQGRQPADKANEEEEEPLKEQKDDDVMSMKSSYSQQTHISLPKRVHMARFDELLSAGQEKLLEEKSTKSSSLAERAMKAALKRQGVKASPAAQAPKSLVDAIEMAEAEAGLSRKSKARMRLGLKHESNNSDMDASSSSSYTSDEEHEPSSKQTGKQEGSRKRSAATFLIEDDDEILDLADPDALAQATTKANTVKNARKIALGKRMAKQLTSLKDSDSLPRGLKPLDAVELSHMRKLKALQDVPRVNGKMILQTGPSLGKRTKQQDDEEDETKSTWMTNPEQDLSSDDETDQRPGNFRRLAGGHGLRRDFMKRQHSTQKTNKSIGARLPGQEYKSQKARGDMKKPGKPDPFAFVPLGSSLVKKQAGGAKATKADRLRLLRGIGLGSRKRKTR